jgi:hypothetical protein
MPDGDKTYSDRIARVRQRNCLPAAASPPAIYVRAPISMKQRRVGKAGSVTIGGGLAQGVKVIVAEVDSQTYVVSARSEPEVRALAESLPRPAVSPFAALSDSLKGRKHDIYGAGSPRPRGPYVGPSAVPEVSDEDVLRGADVRRTRRMR